jgi:abortive infection bacteriophage resistance protein
VLEGLQRVVYYGLSGNVLPFRIPGTDNFRPSVTLDVILGLYKFDCSLRLLTTQALDRNEVEVRAVIMYRLSHWLAVFD